MLSVGFTSNPTKRYRTVDKEIKNPRILQAGDIVDTNDGERVLIIKNRPKEIGVSMIKIKPGSVDAYCSYSNLVRGKRISTIITPKHKT